MEKTEEHKKRVRVIKMRTAFLNSRMKRFKARMNWDPGYSHYSDHEKYMLSVGFRAGIESMLHDDAAEQIRQKTKVLQEGW